jgi:hypothetical protein
MKINGHERWCNSLASRLVFALSRSRLGRVLPRPLTLGVMRAEMCLEASLSGLPKLICQVAGGIVRCVSQ